MLECYLGRTWHVSCLWRGVCVGEETTPSPFPNLFKSHRLAVCVVEGCCRVIWESCCFDSNSYSCSITLHLRAGWEWQVSLSCSETHGEQEALVHITANLWFSQLEHKQEIWPLCIIMFRLSETRAAAVKILLHFCFDLMLVDYVNNSSLECFIALMPQ